ncbi:hypothetical protein EVA_19570 [gut metagenome]|uniref:Uncharacterized protein n=1 Tax=gut metagenome TaxID=749906 RepID=J9FD28_9ZZZZ
MNIEYLSVGLSGKIRFPKGACCSGFIEQPEAILVMELKVH